MKINSAPFAKTLKFLNNSIYVKLIVLIILSSIISVAIRARLNLQSPTPTLNQPTTILPTLIPSPVPQPTILPNTAFKIPADTQFELSKIAGIYPLGYASSTNKIQTLIVYKAGCPGCPLTPEFARYDLYLTENYPENLGKKIDSFEAFGQISTPVAFDGNIAFVYSPQYEAFDMKLYTYGGNQISLVQSKEAQEQMIKDKEKAGIGGGLGDTFLDFNYYRGKIALEMTFTIGNGSDWVHSYDPQTGKYIPGSYRVIKRW